MLMSIERYEVKKNQRHTTNKKPNMYKDINKDNQYFGLSNRPSSGYISNALVFGLSLRN